MSFKPDYKSEPKPPATVMADKAGRNEAVAAAVGTPIAGDCRHYLGDRPCIHNRLCEGCEHYQPVCRRICIIKLGALGDVVRTLCILPELRRQSPNAHITWVSLPNGCRMIGEHPHIDRVMPFDAMTAMVLQQERFDTVISLDKEPQPCALAMTLDARVKLGVGLNAHGKPVPINDACEAYFQLGLSDELKFDQNEKSYARLVYEALGWRYAGQQYELPVNKAAKHEITAHLTARGWQPAMPTVGVFVGAGRVFANKMWPAPRTTQLIRQLIEQARRANIVLLGGPDEKPTISAIVCNLRDTGHADHVIDSGTDHDEQAFIALVDACDVMFCGDTMAMHVAIARKKRIVSYFGPTCQQEIDLFGLGEKLTANVACAPCYKRVCDHGDVCVKAVSVEAAADAIMRQLAACTAHPIRTDNAPCREMPWPLPQYPVREAG